MKTFALMVVTIGLSVSAFAGDFSKCANAKPSPPKVYNAAATAKFKNLDSSYDSIDQFRQLLKAGADPNVEGSRYIDGITHLQVAAMDDNEELVQLLLDYGAGKIQSGHYYLIIDRYKSQLRDKRAKEISATFTYNKAATEKLRLLDSVSMEVEEVKPLLDAGADPNVPRTYMGAGYRDYKTSLLGHAAMRGDVKLAMLLLNHCANTEIQTDDDGRGGGRAQTPRKMAINGGGKYLVLVKLIDDYWKSIDPLLVDTYNPFDF